MTTADKVIPIFILRGLYFAGYYDGQQDKGIRVEPSDEAMLSLKDGLIEKLPKKIICDKHDINDTVAWACCDYCEAIAPYNECLSDITAIIEAYFE